jgi:hypothetical protein
MSILERATLYPESLNVIVAFFRITLEKNGRSCSRVLTVDRKISRCNCD